MRAVVGLAVWRHIACLKRREARGERTCRQVPVLSVEQLEVARIRRTRDGQRPVAAGSFLNALRSERVPVSIYLVNGIKLQGTDRFVRPVRRAAARTPSARWSTSTRSPPWCRRATCACTAGDDDERRRRRSPSSSNDAGTEASECSSARAAVSAPCSCASGWAQHAIPKTSQEFAQLARSAGAEPVATVTGARATGPIRASSSAAARPRKCATVAAADGADLILFNHALSPEPGAQPREAHSSAACSTAPA